MPRPSLPAWERIERRLDRSGPCWLYRNPTHPLGYAKVKVGGRWQWAHRVAYEHFNGPIPGGLPLDHLCNNPPCVNPAHLTPTTHRANTLRGEGPTATNARKTHCMRGHPFDEVNTGIQGDGWRYCRACRRQRHQQQKEAAA